MIHETRIQEIFYSITCITPMTTYTPTKEELEEIGIKNCGGWFQKIIKTKHCNPYTEESVDSVLYIDYFEDENTWQIIKDGFNRNFYPKSLEDIKTLIRLFTPN